MLHYLRKKKATQLQDMGDPYWDKVLLLLHMDGEDNSTAFLDEKGHTIVNNSNVTITSTNAKFLKSGLFSGSNYLSATSSDFVMGLSDLTFEAWVNPTVSSFNPIISNRTGASDGLYFGLYQGSILYYDSALGVFNGGSVPLNTWSHVAITRIIGKVHHIFVQGTLVASKTVTTPVSYTCQSLFVGQDGTGKFSGRMDEVRVTKSCRYTKNFTVPQGPFWSA